jgi:hypothetical protein
VQFDGCVPTVLDRFIQQAVMQRAAPRFQKLDMDLDIAAGRGLEEAAVQSTEIGAVNSWLRNQREEVVSAAVASLREELEPYADGMSVCLPGAMWLISSATA